MEALLITALLAAVLHSYSHPIIPALILALQANMVLLLLLDSAKVVTQAVILVMVL